MNKNKKKRIPMQTPNECDRINDNGYNDKWSMLSPQASTFRDNGSVFFSFFFFLMHFIRLYSFRIFFFTPFHSDCGSSNEIFIRTLRKKKCAIKYKTARLMNKGISWHVEVFIKLDISIYYLIPILLLICRWRFLHVFNDEKIFFIPNVSIVEWSLEWF